MTARPDEARAEEIAEQLCEQARELAEAGDLAGAAAAFQEVLDLGKTSVRPRAACGLGAVRDSLGDLEGARAADRLAIESTDGEYAPRAAYHLAVSYDRAGERERAGEAWEQVVGLGNDVYTPPALLALAELADEDGDAERSTELLRRAAATGDPWHAPRAALSLGIRHLDEAASQLRVALETGDVETRSLATELLARTLPLRGRDEEAAQVWRRGLDDEETAADVRSRLRRGFGVDEREEPDECWWERFVESGVGTGTLPFLTNEVFSALDQMYTLAAVPYARSGAGVADVVRDALGRLVRVPSDYAWGRSLHDSFAARLRTAMGADAPTLPPGWPDPGL